MFVSVWYVHLRIRVWVLNLAEEPAAVPVAALRLLPELPSESTARSKRWGRVTSPPLSPSGAARGAHLRAALLWQADLNRVGAVEPAGEFGESLGLEVELARDDNHAVLVERILDHRPRRVVHLGDAGQVDAVQPHPELRVQRLDPHRRPWGGELGGGGGSGSAASMLKLATGIRFIASIFTTSV